MHLKQLQVIRNIQVHLRLALLTTAYVLTCCIIPDWMKSDDYVPRKSRHCQNVLMDPEVGHWQSSLASVRKLSDTLCVEVFPFKLSLHC